MNWLILLLSACIPLAVGFIWYHPKVFGTTWMRVARLRPEEMKGRNMILVLLLSVVLGFLISGVLMQLTIHQFGFYGSLAGKENEAGVKALRAAYESIALHNYRTFKHGAFHGFIAGLGLAMPIIAINALFERRSFKYVAVHAGYWILCLLLMGGTVCQFIQIDMPK